MSIYEFITPSDPVTFKADDDKIAYLCAILLGNGKAGCKNITEGKNLSTLLMFSSDPEKEMSDFIGSDVGKFIEENRVKISECFSSFAYGSASDRKTYDSACELITDAEKLKTFKANHENENRSSMSKWVQGAWQYAEAILNPASADK